MLPIPPLQPPNLTPEELDEELTTLIALSQQDYIAAAELRGSLIFRVLKSIANGAEQPELLAAMLLGVDPFEEQH